MSSIKLDVNIKLPKVDMFSRKEKPSLFKGVPSKYKFVVFEDGKLENYYVSKMHY